jgi:hypothetical protein
MSIVELKRLVYLAQTGFGLLLCYLALVFSQTDDAVQLLSAWLMVLVGSGLIGFGVLTFVLKDDPDIWR